jgi:hypothetical protein
MHYKTGFHHSEETLGKWVFGERTLLIIGSILSEEPTKEWCNIKYTKNGRDPIVSRPQFIDRGPGLMNHGRDTIGSLPFYVRLYIFDAIRPFTLSLLTDPASW